MTIAPRLSRRAVLRVLSLATPALLAACASHHPPTTFAPLDFSYLPKLYLKVASLSIIDAWAPNPNSRERGFLAPTTPEEALKRMAEERLVAVGPSGKAEFVIEDASIVEHGPDYIGNFAVRLNILTGDGKRVGSAEARVYRTANINDDSPAGVRAELYTLVKEMMNDMNVEFEYEVRHALGSFLSSGLAPPPPKVQQQTLAPPTSTPVPSTAPAAGANTLSAPTTLTPPAASAPANPPPITPPLLPALTPAAPASPVAVPFAAPAPVAH